MALNDKDDIQKQNIPENQKPAKAANKGRRKAVIIVSVVIAVLAIALALPRILGFGANTAGTSAYTPYTVARGDITETLSGSGTLQPADSYTISSLISGEIITAPFEEGDVVSQDEVLYTVDSSDVSSSIQQAENNLADTQTNYNNILKQRDNLSIKAGGTGSVIDLSVEVGDTVSSGQTVAVIRNSSVMTVKILFQKEFALGLTVGSAATVSLGGTNESFNGVVSAVSVADTVLTGNSVAREVTIDVSNPGAFAPEQTVYVSVNGASGLASGTLAYKYQGNVVATASGKVSQLNVSTGSLVSKGQVIVTLQSDTLDEQIQSAHSAMENAQLALDNQNNKIGDYSVTSPIAGTIVQKDYKQGDTLKAGEVLCTVLDLSHLTLTLNVDELDIKKVQNGQTVTITADASPDTEYSGIVTKINISGTTKNGVTSYPVTIRLDQTDGLLPGMNVDAKIVVESLTNVLLVPVTAVLRNNFVLIKTDEPTTTEADAGIPAGLKYIEVTLGASNDEYIVIERGLNEGDVVGILDMTPSSYNTNPFANRAENRMDTLETGTDGGVTSAQSEPAAAGVAG